MSRSNCGCLLFLTEHKHMPLFPDKNGVVIRTDWTVGSRIIGFPPPAILFDKNTFLLQANSPESAFEAVLCEHGKALTLINFFFFFVFVISQMNVYDILILEINTTGCEFASAESYYKKIVGSANNYSYYALKCKGKLCGLEYILHSNYRPHPKDDGRLYFQFVCQFTPGGYPVQLMVGRGTPSS